MRIITGKFRGRKIHPPQGLQARPTTDFAKTGVFNIMDHQFDWEKSTMLDLFSGSGNISFEMISRGAEKVTAVDVSQLSNAFLQKFSAQLGIENLRVVKADVLKFLNSDQAKYDVIFADPPYEWEQTAGMIETIMRIQKLKPEGWLIVEHGPKENFSHLPGFFDHRKYGRVNFSFFKAPEA